MVFGFSSCSLLTPSLLWREQNGSAEVRLAGVLVGSCRQVRSKTVRKETTGFCSEKGGSPWPR